MRHEIITVVIPTRNRPTLLLRAIKSVQRQSYADLEIVVVVDGPDPATLAMLNDLQELRMRVLALEEPVGGSEARNIGVRTANGERIAFLDDDDEWMPLKLEKQMNLLQAAGNPKAVVACKIIGRYPQQEYVWPRRVPRNGEPLCEYLFNRHSLFRGEGQLQTSMLLVPRELMLKLPFRSGLNKHQDTDWYIRMAVEPGYQVLFVEEALAVWYLGDSRDSIVRRFNWIESWEWLLSVETIMTKRAFAGFIASQLIGEAGAQGCAFSAGPFLFEQMFQKGRPGIMDCVLFFGNAALTPQTRSFSRRLLAKQG